jgi:hypothetical protein
MNDRAALLLALVAFAPACGGAEPDAPDDEPFVRDSTLDEAELTSAPGLAESHENGANCMACHSAASDSAATAGPGLFSVGLSLFIAGDDALAPLSGATLELRTAPFGEGDLVASIPSDDLGNVYTTEPIDFFGAPLFPHVTRGAASISMPFPTQSGACNMCHFTGGVALVVEE